MPISTVTFETNALAQMEALDSALSQTQAELSTGSKLPNAAADPVAMVEVNQLNSALSASQQQVSNGNAVTSSLQLEQNALTNATNALQSARDLAVEGNNTDLTLSDRQALAAQLQQLQQTLLGAANSQDANGAYLFGGTANSAPPFIQSGTSVTYQGSAQVNQVQIGPDQSVSVGDAGSSVFMNLPSGNGTFTTAVGTGNTGNASIDPGSVVDPSQWVPSVYTVTFSSPTQYQVTNSAGTVVTSGNYSSGNAITFAGAQVTVSGDPAAGDTFTVAPATQTSVFATLSNLIGTLNSSTLSSAQITTQIGGAIGQIDTALNGLDNTQAAVGGRLNAVTAAGNSAQTAQTNMQSSISQLSNTDYAAAVTQLSSQELALQAAQESYASIAHLSLFNYLS
jgi:flagellar hook-associated protein 3 FlgL